MQEFEKFWTKFENFFVYFNTMIPQGKVILCSIIFQKLKKISNYLKIFDDCKPDVQIVLTIAYGSRFGPFSYKLFASGVLCLSVWRGVSFF